MGEKNPASENLQVKLHFPINLAFTVFLASYDEDVTCFIFQKRTNSNVKLILMTSDQCIRKQMVYKYSQFLWNVLRRLHGDMDKRELQRPVVLSEGRPTVQSQDEMSEPENPDETWEVSS